MLGQRGSLPEYCWRSTAAARRVAAVGAVATKSQEGLAGCCSSEASIQSRCPFCVIHLAMVTMCPGTWSRLQKARVRESSGGMDRLPQDTGARPEDVHGSA